MSGHGGRPGRGVLRRDLLLAGVGIISISQCDVRLEDDAPDLPLLPTREPIPQEDRLLRLRADCDTLARTLNGWQPAEPDSALEGTTAALVAALSALHEQQATDLTIALSRAGVPASVLDAPTSQATSAADDVPDLTAVAAAELAWPGGGLSVLDCGAGVRPLVAAALAQRVAASWALLGAAPTWPELEPATDSSPGQPWRDPSVLLRPLSALHQLRYAAEVAGAHTEIEIWDGLRDQYGTVSSRDTGAVSAARAATEELHRRVDLIRSLVTWVHERAGDVAPVEPLAWSLPETVTDAATGADLVADAVRSARTQLGGLLAVLPAGDGIEARDTLTWVAALEVVGIWWGMDPVAFPGLDSA